MTTIYLKGRDKKNNYKLTTSKGQITITNVDELNPTSVLLTQVESVSAEADKLSINYVEDVEGEYEETSMSFLVKLDVEELAKLSEDEVTEYVAVKTANYAKKIAKDINCPFIKH